MSALREWDVDFSLPISFAVTAASASTAIAKNTLMASRGAANRTAHTMQSYTPENLTTGLSDALIITPAP